MRSLTLLLLCLLPLFAWGKGQLQAAPVLLQVMPGQSATRLRLSNTGDERLVAQIRVYAWQQDGEDQLLPSDVVAASPPIAEIEPGSQQLVRLVYMGEPAMAQDLNYRVVVDEVPLHEDSAQSGVAVRMRYVLPLFLRASEAAQPQLSCHLQDQTLECVNTGGRAAQLGASQLVDTSGSRLTLSEGLLGYVLPGSRKTWQLPGGTDASSPNTQDWETLETWIDGQLNTIRIEAQRQ